MISDLVYDPHQAYFEFAAFGSAFELSHEDNTVLGMWLAVPMEFRDLEGPL